MVGGMVREGRLCCWPPRRMLALPVRVLVSPFCLRGGPVEWREWWVACCPRVRIGSGTLHCPVPLHVIRFPRIIPVPLLFCVAVFVVGGEVRWCVVCGLVLVFLFFLFLLYLSCWWCSG